MTCSFAQWPPTRIRTSGTTMLPFQHGDQYTLKAPTAVMELMLGSLTPPSSSPFNYKPENNWRTTNIKGTPFIPILLGAWWSEGWSEYHDTVPKYPGQLETITYDDMGHFCINRHQGYINVIFMDYSVRKVPLKHLWRLRWHRKYPLSAAPPADWNDPDHWMHDFPNY